MGQPLHPIYALSEVVAGVTHEVRDVLQGAFGHLWLARRGAPPLPAEALEVRDSGPGIPPAVLPPVALLDYRARSSPLIGRQPRDSIAAATDRLL